MVFIHELFVLALTILVLLLGRLKIDGLPRLWSFCTRSCKLLFLTLNHPDSAARAIENRWFAPPVESLRLFSQALILDTQPS